MRISLSTLAVGAAQARIVDFVPVFFWVRLTISHMGVITVCFAKVCRLRSIDGFSRLPFPLNGLVALPSLAMEAARIYIVELVSMCFWVNLYICFEAIISISL